MDAAVREKPAEAAFGRDAAFLVLIQVLWGTNWITSKIALAEMPPLALMVIRFSAVFLIFAPFMRWHKGHMRDLALTVLLGGAVHFGVGFYALAIAHDIAPLAVAGNLSVPFATVLSALFLGDRIGKWRALALVLAFGGVVVMSFDPRIMGYLEAIVLNAFAAFCWAVSAILMRRLRTINPFDMQAWIALGTWPPLLIASALLEPGAMHAVTHASLEAWLSTLYIIVGASVIGHVGFNWLIHRHPVPRVAPFLLLAPIIGSGLGVIFLGDVMTWRIAAGAALTLSGVLLIIIREGRRQRT